MRFIRERAPRQYKFIYLLVRIKDKREVVIHAAKAFVRLVRALRGSDAAHGCAFLPLSFHTQEGSHARADRVLGQSILSQKLTAEGGERRLRHAALVPVALGKPP